MISGSFVFEQVANSGYSMVIFTCKSQYGASLCNFYDNFVPICGNSGLNYKKGKCIIEINKG